MKIEQLQNKESLSIELYYGIDDDTDEIVFDEESIRDDFEMKLQILLSK